MQNQSNYLITFDTQLKSTLSKMGVVLLQENPTQNYSRVNHYK